MALWHFGRKKKRVNEFNLSTDLHSHIIPGIDDGSKTLEESIAMLRAMQNIWYSKVITTPHIMVDVYRNTPKIVREKLELLREEANSKGLSIEIDAAAEYYLDDGFLEHLNSGDILSFGDKYLLFETSYMDKPINMEEMIFEIQSAGFKPVLAHPERYRYINDMEVEYSKLKKLGVLFQLNLNSLIGGYGKSAKQKAEFLIKKGWISFLGSDAHSLKHIEGIKKAKSLNIFDTIFKNNNILNDNL